MILSFSVPEMRPTLTIDAADPLAPDLVDELARRQAADGIDPKTVAGTRALALEMRAWRLRNTEEA